MDELEDSLKDYENSLVSKRFDIAKAIILKLFKKKFGGTILYIASHCFLPDAVKSILPTSILNFQDSNKQTLLHLTISVICETQVESQIENHQDFLKLVKQLLELGANPNIQNELGNSPLHLAVCCRSVEIIKLLCRSGGDLFAINNLGYSPHHLVWLLHFEECAQVLVDGYYNYKKLKNNFECAIIYLIMTFFLIIAVHSISKC